MPNDPESELRALDKLLTHSRIGRWSWDFDETLELDATAAQIIGVSEPQSSYILADLLMRVQEPFHIRILDSFEQCLLDEKPLDITVDLEDEAPAKIRLQAELTVGGNGRSKCFIGILEAVNVPAHQDGVWPNPLQSEYWSETIDMLCLTNPEGLILDVNPEWERALGYAHSEVIGTPILDMVHEDDLAHSRPPMTGLQDHAASGSIGSRFRTKSGGELWLRLTWTALAERGLRVWHARDISRFKHEEHDRLLTIESMRDSNEELQSFASVASHDLREPLRMISSYLRLLQERYPDALDARAERYINYACDGADRMRTLIEDLLGYARIGSQKLDLEPLGLDQIMEEVIDNLSTSIKQLNADVTIEIDQSPVVLGDSVRLVRLFQNLIGNAMKFHAEGVEPRVQVSFQDGDQQADPGCWIVHVRDNGIGIDSDHIGLLFNAFQRLNTRDEYEGSGIGLAVCRKLAEQHGGRIWVESELGKGSCFSVSLKKPDRL